MTIKSIIARSVLAAALLAAFGCSRLQGEDGARGKDDKPRPTEGGEGVPGYLSDPALVRAVLLNGELIVEAAAGTVRNDNGPVADVVLCLQQAPRIQIDSQAIDPGAGIVISAEILAKGRAAADGSFRLAVARTRIDAQQVLSLATGPGCGQVLIERLESGTSGVPRGGGAGAGTGTGAKSADGVPADPPALKQSGVFESGIASPNPPPIDPAQQRPLATVGVYDFGKASFELLSRHDQAEPDYDVLYGHFSYLPLVGDWDGDGRHGIGVVDLSAASKTMVFYLRDTLSPGAPDHQFLFGSASGLPVAGDWDGDGRYGVGVFEPERGRFSLRDVPGAGEPSAVITWGKAGDLPVAGDWDGDGRTDVGVYRPSTSEFLLRRGDGREIRFVFGHSSYKPVTGDWDGDGRTNVGVYAPDAGRFMLLMRDGSVSEVAFGFYTDAPLGGVFAPL